MTVAFLPSLNIAGSGITAQRRRMDVLTNNIANMETAGFKADSVISRSFRDLMLHQVGDPAILYSAPSVGPLNTGVRVDEVSTSFEPGNVEDTGRSTDICIIGDGFYVVATAAGDRYTRNGNFAVTPDGYLTNSDGNYIMGTAGMINVGDANFTVNYNGDITRSDGTYAGQIRIVEFADLNGLRKTGDNLFLNFTGQAVLDGQNYELRQNSLETSNVNIASEMVDMLTLYRSYESSQRVLRIMDEMIGKAVNEVGRI